MVMIDENLFVFSSQTAIFHRKSHIISEDVISQRVYLLVYQLVQWLVQYSV
jgi:hypothetical protein